MEVLPIQVSPGGGLPLYRQLVNQITYLVASGTLTPGQEMTPIRVLAEQLLINPNTVARAYRELEMAGILSKRPGAGTYVSGAGSPLRRRERLRLLREKVSILLAEGRQLGFSVDEIAAELRKEDKHLNPGAVMPVRKGGKS